MKTKISGAILFLVPLFKNITYDNLKGWCHSTKGEVSGKFTSTRYKYEVSELGICIKFELLRIRFVAGQWKGWVKFLVDTVTSYCMQHVQMYICKTFTWIYIIKYIDSSCEWFLFTLLPISIFRPTGVWVTSGVMRRPSYSTTSMGTSYLTFWSTPLGSST